MKPDGTDSFSTAHGRPISPKGTRVSGQDEPSRSEVKHCPNAAATSWTYLFVHHNKVMAMEQQLKKDGITYFIHKTVRYIKKTGKSKVQRKEMPTVSGLVFFQGYYKATEAYLKETFPYNYLCKNCSTGRVAVIPDAQMRPFMRINEAEPERIRFLLKPFHYYARNRILLRITDGELAGLEGYVIRIDRDRRLVMDVGGLSVAIAGVHAEHFEEVAPSAADMESLPLQERNLQEREAIIDRYFHPVKTAGDVAMQAENIDYLREYVLTELAHKRMDLRKAWDTFAFIFREISDYYSPFLPQFEKQLTPILRAGANIFQAMDRLLDTCPMSNDEKETFQARQADLLAHYEYMF